MVNGETQRYIQYRGEQKLVGLVTTVTVFSLTQVDRSIQFLHWLQCQRGGGQGGLQTRGMLQVWGVLKSLNNKIFT